MLEELGITFDGTTCTLSRQWTQELDFGLLGLMLDAFHQDELNQDAVRILECVKQEYPANSLVLRNYARALGQIGRHAECLQIHRESLLLPDADDTTAVWFGNELHNRKRHVDAAEAYLVGAVKDPDDARPLVHFADEVSLAHTLVDGGSQIGHRGLPKSIGDERALIATALIAAISLGGLTPDTVQRARTVAKRADVDIEALESFLSPEDQPPTSRAQRAKFVRVQYEHFRSELTTVPARH